MAGISSLKKLVDIRRKEKQLAQKELARLFQRRERMERELEDLREKLFYMASETSVQRLRLEFERRNVLREDEAHLIEMIRKLDEEEIPPSRDRATRAEQQARMVELLLERKKKELAKQAFREETKQLDEAGRSRWLRKRKPES